MVLNSWWSLSNIVIETDIVKMFEELHRRPKSIIAKRKEAATVIEIDDL